jgi:hypothetical protein
VETPFPEFLTGEYFFLSCFQNGAPQVEIQAQDTVQAAKDQEGKE